MSVEPVNLPLFPLNTVLYPGMELPLRIFEERYKLMVEECVEQDALFGVVLIRRGSEVGKPADPYEVGTTARIVAMQRLDEGRMNIVAEGKCRFRIRAVVQKHPYTRALVELLWESHHQQVDPQLVKSVRDAANGYLNGMAALQGGWLREAWLPDDPIALSYHVATILGVDRMTHQHLLETDSAAKRLQEEVALLQGALGRLRKKALQQPIFDGPRLN